MEATTTSTGVEVYQCTVCGDVDTKVIPVKACDHNEENPEKADSSFNVIENHAATCEAAGETRYECSKCHKIITKISPMLEHESDTKEGEGRIISDPVKCVSDGSEEVVCKYCEKTFTRAISAHRFEVTRKIEATCTEPAQVVSKCKDCGVEKTEVEVVDRVKSVPLGHEFVTRTEIAATCTTDGREAKLCTRCSYTEKETIPATGHKVLKSGAGDTGVKYYAVKYDEDGEIVKLTNSAGEFIEITDYAAGMKKCEYAIAECFYCENEKTNNETATTANCKEIVTVVADKQAHSIDTTKTVTTGIFLCDDEGNITINRVNGKVVGLTNAVVDCTHAKATVFTCKNCQQPAYTIDTPKADHVKLEGSERRVNPTCTTTGRTLYTCSICKAEVTDTEIPKLKHNFEIKKENCTEGAKIRCTICGKTATVTNTGSEASPSYTVSPDDVNYPLEGVNDYFNALTEAQKKALTAPSKGGHDFEGNSQTTVNGQTGMYCNRCGEFVVSLSFEEEPVKATMTADKVDNSNEEIKAKEEATIKRMGKVKITRTNNVVTIEQIDKFDKTTDFKGTATDENPYNPSTEKNSNCFGIMLNLGIKASNLVIDTEKSSGNYSFGEADIKSTEMARFGAKDDTSTPDVNELDYYFMIWLAKEDFKDDGNSYSITFEDKSGENAPITIKFVYNGLEDPYEAEG